VLAEAVLVCVAAVEVYLAMLVLTQRKLFK
jgi:hypothetical protein